MKKQYKIIVLSFLAFSILYFYHFDVFAGSINAAEQRVISAASGTFTYNGDQYKAYSSYVGELKSYLAKDDIDLTSADANSLISDINSSVADGIEGGYLYKISGSDETTTENVENDSEESKESIENDIKDKEKKNYDIAANIANNHLFKKTEESIKKNSVIKNTGYSTNKIVFVSMCLIILTVLLVFVARYFDLFAHSDES